MTGFAAQTGTGAGHSWSWEARSVNSKGLDLRLRLPDGIEGLEAAVRAAATERFARGSITLSLRIERDAANAGGGIDPAGLLRALTALQVVEAEAARVGVPLAQSSAVDILGVRGVIETTPQATEAQLPALKSAVLADLPPLLEALALMRATEGAALHDVLTGQVARIEALADEAAAQAEARVPVQRETLAAALARVMEAADGADADRVAQELALIAVKADVTEEIDRLRAHVQAARALLAEAAPVGRRLDFLSQEFNREANTLAAKSNFPPLTNVALQLKAVIDQMREQVQNVE